MELVFRKDLPTIPYIDAVDFLNVYFKTGMTEKEQTNGTILVSKDQYEMTVDTEKDKIILKIWKASSNRRPKLRIIMMLIF